eukprot:1715002-Rhodomonas_salina.1
MTWYQCTVCTANSQADSVADPGADSVAHTLTNSVADALVDSVEDSVADTLTASIADTLVDSVHPHKAFVPGSCRRAR